MSMMTVIEDEGDAELRRLYGYPPDVPLVSVALEPDEVTVGDIVCPNFDGFDFGRVVDESTLQGAPGPARWDWWKVQRSDGTVSYLHKTNVGKAVGCRMFVPTNRKQGEQPV
jgi:hypothetical protein